LIHQFLDQTPYPNHYVSADAVPAASGAWISQQWETARQKCLRNDQARTVFVIDEVQKIENWSEQVKKEWDKDSKNKLPLHVVLLGSSRLLLQQGLTESLAGRFESTYLGHWTFDEMHNAFGFSTEQFVWFGGYPGAAALIDDEQRWKQYVNDSLIETTVSKDILMMTRVDKPALMKRLFELGCDYSGQILSFNKILGQLQDAGNTTTLSHYLKLLDTAGLLTGIEKFSPNTIRKRASSPKFQVHNTALMSAVQSRPFNEIKNHPELWGRWVESAAGAHLLNHSINGQIDLYYWRHSNHEVDFVIQKGDKAIALEVKSGTQKNSTGVQAFNRQFQPHKMLLIGSEGIALDEFLKIDPHDLF
jgi:predicted AAA+ superfamily ATPase